MEHKQKVNRADISKILPKQLQKFRTLLGFSQNYVADQLCISRQTYSHYETGRITPPVDTLCQLADLYQVSIDTLLSHNSTAISKKEYSDSSTQPIIPLNAEEAEYLNFIDSPKNKKKLSELSEEEKHLLFYYYKLEKRDQKDILDFMKLKYLNRFS